LRPPFGGFADLQQLHPVRLAGQGVQIALELGVGDQMIVRPDLMAERLQRGGEGAGGGGRGRDRGRRSGGFERQDAGRREGQDGQPGGQSACGSKGGSGHEDS